MKLKRTIATGLLLGIASSIVMPLTVVETKSYSVDTTLESTTTEYRNVAIENLEVPTVTAFDFYAPTAIISCHDDLPICMVANPYVKQVQTLEKSNTTETETTEEKPLVVYTTKYLNVRQEPNQEAKKINILPPNTEVEVKEVNDDWYSFDFEECTYFINAGYVTSDAPNEDEIIEIIGLNNDIEGNFFRYKKSQEEIERVIETVAVSNALYTPGQFQNLGVIYYGDYRWTWYSERVLPGGGLKIPGRHNDENGYICDEDGYICLASSTLSKGTILNTPFVVFLTVVLVSLIRRSLVADFECLPMFCLALASFID